MRVLVTGAAGFVGRHISEYLIGHGYDVIRTDKEGTELIGDIRDKEFVFKKLGSVEFDAIVHLAAIADLKKTIDDPHTCFEINSFGTLNMLELALKKKVKRFVLASSANVYGAPKELPVREEASFSPRVPYDYSKVISEYLAMSYFKVKSLPVSITRSWLLFGEYDMPNRAIIRFIQSCLRNEPLILFNSGMDTTAPSHAVNYAKLVMLILENEVSVGKAFNFGGEKVLSVRELAELIKGLTDSRSDIILQPPRSEFELEPQISYPSTDRIRSMLNYEYELTLEQGLLRTIDWVKHKNKFIMK